MTPLADGGNYTYKAVVADHAANEGSVSVDFVINVDLTSPTAIASVTAIGVDTDGAGDFINSDNTLVIAGTLTEALGSGEKVQASIDDGAWLDVYEYNAGTLTWSVDYTMELILDDGVYTIAVRVIDEAGNITSGVERDIVVDTSVPEATSSILSITEDTGVANDFITSDQTLLIRGDVTGTLKSSEKVQIRFDGGSWIDTDYNRVTQTWEHDHRDTTLAERVYQVMCRLSIRLVRATGILPLASPSRFI